MKLKTPTLNTLTPKTMDPVESKKSGGTSPADRRQCKRVPLTFPIEVSGFDDAGHLFRESTITTDISDNGCKFSLLRKLKQGEVIAIQVGGRHGERSEKNKPLLFEVAWVEPSELGWTLGAAKLQPDNIWHMAFPPKERVENH